jgi:hypothetical protein
MPQRLDGSIQTTGAILGRRASIAMRTATTARSSSYLKVGTKDSLRVLKFSDCLSRRTLSMEAFSVVCSAVRRVGQCRWLCWRGNWSVNGLSLLLDVSDVGMYESRRPDDSSSLCMNVIIPIRMRIHIRFFEKVGCTYVQCSNHPFRWL